MTTSKPPRPLTAAQASASVASGSRWAWQLESKLAAVYETLILEAYQGAATALAARTLTASAGWTVPNEDEIGDSLRRKYEQRADDSSTAIRVEAIRRVTKTGLQLMHVNLEAVNPLLEGVISGLGGNIEIADTTRRDILASIEASWKDGDSIPKTAARLRAAAPEIAKTRSLLIARTELIGAINAGAHALGIISNDYAPAGAGPLLKIWLTAEDEKVRDSHVEAGDAYGAGSGIPLDQPFQVGDSSMQFPGDQNGSAEEVCNCLPGSTLVDAPGVRGVMRRWYEGDLVEARFASGRVLAATPNHPVLRADGIWTAIGALAEGDDCLSGRVIRQLSGEPNVQRDPSKLSEVYESAQHTGVTKRIGTRPPDLHGDATHGEVEVVAVDGHLLLDEDAATNEEITEFGLALAYATIRGGASDGLSAWIYSDFSTPPSRIRRGGIGAALIDSPARGLEAVRLEESANGDACLHEASRDRASSDSRLACEFRDARAIEVAPDQLVEIHRYPFAGWVYNLDTGVGWYSANGIITQNCRCALSYEEGGALTASMESPVESYTFKGRALRATGALTASGVPVYAIDPEDLPEAIDPYVPPEGGEAIDADEAVEMAAPGRTWTCVLAVTGEKTSDGRMLMPGGIRWRDLPLTLTMQLELAPEHMGALVVGRIDEIEVMSADAAVSAGLMPEQDGGYASDAEAIIGRGVWDNSMLGDEAMRLVADKMLRGVSIDLAPDSVEVVEEAPEPGEEYGELVELVPSGEIMGATVCAHPAFGEANIMVDAVLASASPALGILRVSVRASIQGPVAPALTAAAVDYSSHSMIATHPTPSEASAIAQPGGQPAGDLHVTLAYLPNPDSIDFDALHKVVAKVAADHATITGAIGGAGYFAPSPPAADAAPEKPSDAPDDQEPDADPDDKPVTAAATPPPEPVADPETPADSEGEQAPGQPGDGDQPHPHVAFVDAPGLSKMRTALCAALDDAGISYAQNHDFTPHMTLGYEAQPGTPAMGCAGCPTTFSHLTVHQGPTRTDHPMSDVQPDGLTASAAGLAPLAPPSEWFENPELPEPTPLTVTDEGRIYGHLATWGTCHVGMRDACVQPPSSEMDYALFHLGHVETAEGDLVPCGTFQMDTNHAGLRASMRAAQEHYDHTGTAVADVRCGEDEHGIWFAGAIRPDLSAVKLRALRAAQISGDWRAHNGHLEFAAGIAVNIPGYPVVRPRVAVAASGFEMGLVAAGVDLRVASEPIAVQRLRAFERVLPGYLAAQREQALARIRG